MTTFNPNWAAFAHSQGMHPGETMPGPSVNAWFINWISEQAKAFTDATGITKESHPGEYPDLFSEWLTDAYPQPDYDGGRLVRPR